MAYKKKGMKKKMPKGGMGMPMMMGTVYHKMKKSMK